MASPRVVIGKGRVKSGRKCRVRYPSIMGGYITHTYISIAEAKRNIAKLSSQQKRRAKIIKL